MKSLESKLILGSEVHFQSVRQLNEKIHLEIGHYDQELPDPFVIRLDYPRPFTWLSLGEWLNFSNNYGFILMNKDHLQFQKYVLDFIKTSDNFDKITHLLKTNPVMALRSEISVFLESGQLISPGSLQSPFLEFRFFRNCFQSEYENGACFQ